MKGTLPSAGAAHEINDTFQFEELSQARSYPLSVLRAFTPYIGQHILEVGCGVGNFTRFIRQRFPDCKLTLLDPNPDFCNQVSAAYPEAALCNGIASELPPGFQCDTIFNVNVLEHIEDDEDELRSYAKLLSVTGGHLCLFLPARPEIYAPIDEAFGHYRRYTRPELREKLSNAGFRVKVLRYSNLAGYFGWAMEFKQRKQMHFSRWKVLAFDRFAWPLFSRIERVIPPPIGQNLLAIGEITR